MEERGLRILESNLQDLDYDERFDARDLFNLLSEGKIDDAFGDISKKIDTLTKEELEDGE